MNRMHVMALLASCVLIVGTAVAGAEDDSAAEAAKLLALDASGSGPEEIDYESLPRLEGKHAVVSPAVLNPGVVEEKYDLHHIRFQLHSYLTRHAGRFWCIWSDGPPIEDEPTQEVRYATSEDGLTWSEARPVTGTPTAPHAFIARGLWVRDGELLALAAHFQGKGAFGAPEQKQLELRAYAWDPAAGAWKLKGKVFDNAINNFAPQRLPSGDWIMTRRDTRFNVSMLIGGRRSLDDWEVFPVVDRGAVPGFNPDEPIIWVQPDGSMVGLFRNNGPVRRLFHSTSTDEGRTWSQPRVSDFPDAGSKLFSMRTSRGYRVLVSNANPGANRRELYLSISEDGRTFTRMARLMIPAPPPVSGVMRVWHKFGPVASVQYPHVIEHDGRLMIAFSRNKKQIEVLHVPLDAVDRVRAK